MVFHEAEATLSCGRTPSKTANRRPPTTVSMEDVLIKARGLIASCCLMLASLLNPCSIISAQSQSASDKALVRVGGAASLMYLPFYVGVEQGFFSKHDISIESLNLNNPIPSLLSGEIDVALNGSDSAVISAARGRPTPAVVMMQQRNSMSLTANPTVKLPSKEKGYPDKLADLKGKTIGIIGRGSGAEVFVKQMMNGVGMEEGKDYNIVVIGTPSGLIAALRASQVDAVNLWSPFQEQAWVEKAGVPLVREVEEGPPGRRLAAGISIHANPEFLKNKADIAKRFIAAMEDADSFTRDIKNNREKLLDIAVKYTGVKDREALATALPTISSLAYPGIDCDAWSQTAKGLVSVNSISTAPKCEEMTASIASAGPTGPAK